ECRRWARKLRLRSLLAQSLVSPPAQAQSTPRRRQRLAGADGAATPAGAVAATLSNPASHLMATVAQRRAAADRPAPKSGEFARARNDLSTPRPTRAYRRRLYR